MRGGKSVFIEPHRLNGEWLVWHSVESYMTCYIAVRTVAPAGVFIARGKEDALVTKNLVPGDSVYGEKRISVEVKI